MISKTLRYKTISHLDILLELCVFFFCNKMSFLGTLVVSTILLRLAAKLNVYGRKNVPVPPGELWLASMADVCFLQLASALSCNHGRNIGNVDG